MNTQAIKEALKEIARVLIFAAVPWAIAYVTALPETQTTAIGLLILRAVDKYLHENPNVEANGLTPF